MGGDGSQTRWRRDAVAATDGLAGPVMCSAGFFLFFFFIYRGRHGNRLG
jgi:hypothetical protein